MVHVNRLCFKIDALRLLFEFLYSSSTFYSIARQNYFIQKSWVRVKQRNLAKYLYGNQLPLNYGKRGYRALGFSFRFLLIHRNPFTTSVAVMEVIFHVPFWFTKV